MTDCLTIRLKALISKAVYGLFNRFGFQCSISLFLCFSICYDGWINFSLVIAFYLHFVFYKFQLKGGCEFSDQIEGFNFGSSLSPTEQVGVLGSTSLFLRISNLIVTWSNFYLIIDFFLEALYHLLSRFGFLYNYVYVCTYVCLYSSLHLGVSFWICIIWGLFGKSSYAS